VPNWHAIIKNSSNPSNCSIRVLSPVCICISINTHKGELPQQQWQKLGQYICLIKSYVKKNPQSNKDNIKFDNGRCSPSEHVVEDNIQS